MWPFDSAKKKWRKDVLEALDGVKAISYSLSDDYHVYMSKLEREMAQLHVDFSAIRAQMAANKSAMDSAVALIQDIKKKLEDALANTDDSVVRAEVAAIAAEMDANDDALAGALVESTPAAEEPAPPAPEPVVEPAPATPTEETPPQS